jgi:hypothetical protein
VSPLCGVYVLLGEGELSCCSSGYRVGAVGGRVWILGAGEWRSWVFPVGRNPLLKSEKWGTRNREGMDD